MSNDGPPQYPDLLTQPAWRRVAADHALTPQELAALRLVCRGLSNAGIASRLGIRPPTLRSHLRNAYRKLGCRNRVDTILRLVHGHGKKS